MRAHNLIKKLTESGKINWDVSGLGGTPNQQSVDYFGFIRPMTPPEFRRLVPPGNARPDSAGYIAGEMRKGAAIAPPFLQLDWIADRGAWQVVDHEGRSRADAAMVVDPAGVMPVSMLPRGLRARHLTPEMRAAVVLPQRWRA